MKNLKFLSYLFVAVLCLGFTSCSDDDDDKNVMVYSVDSNSESYDIYGGQISSWGEYSDNLYDFDLNLYTKEVSFDKDEEEFIVGQGGKMLQIEIWASSAELTTGTYTYDPDYSEVAGTFTYMGFGGENGELAKFTEGTVVVTKSGENYTLVIAGKNAAGKTITAYYHGTLNKYTMTQWM